MVDIAEAADFVNGERTKNPQAGIGHNGGPDFVVREINKLQAIDAVLKDKRYSQTEALILIGLIVRSGPDFDNAYPGAATLAVYAKVKRRDTVFTALRELEETHKVIQRQSRGQGRSNAYRVLSQEVVDQIVEAYDSRKQGRTAKADGPEETKTPKADESEAELSRLNRTTQQESQPVNADATRPVEADATRPVEPDTIHSLSNPVSVPSPVKGTAFFLPFNYGCTGIDYQDGKVVLNDQSHEFWLEQFDGDESVLQLALIDAACNLQPNNRVYSVETQISRKLSQIARDRKDRRANYERAVTAKEVAKKQAKTTTRLRRY